VKTNTSLPSNIIYCPRSGLPLAKVEARCSHGWPMINSMASTTSGLLHPIYGIPLEKLLIKLRDHLAESESIAWCSLDSDQREIQLTMSAIMYAIDSIWLPPVLASHLWNRLEASLPSWPVCVASGSRLLRLASWYHYATSKRLELPKYRICTDNKNLHWENLSAWLDDAFSVKTEWESGRDRLQQAEEVKTRTDALLTIKSEAVYKRIDLNKVWRWVEVQMKEDSRYGEGRRETFKTIFMSADLSPEEWTLDDIEDVQLAILETCDAGNDIMFFIRTRLNSMRAVIQDFYSSFTLLTKVSSEGLDALDMVSPLEQKKTGEFFATFDRRIDSLESLPPEPKRESFATMAKFLQAQAQHRILKRRWDARKTEAQPDQEQAAQTSKDGE
jgi:hypothetical protein